MPEINPLYHSLIFGTLMSALDNMGISPVLIARQTARILTPIIKDISKQAIGQAPSSNMETFIEQVKASVELGGLGDPKTFEINFSENVLSSKLSDCMYLNIANFAKSLGYDACPICSMSVTTMGTLSALGFGEVVDFKVECDGKTCLSKLIIEK